jgi:hypothetical protein
MVAAFFILAFLLTLGWLIWVAAFLANGPVEKIYGTKRHQFLGPGGPDDPFANDPFDDRI